MAILKCKRCGGDMTLMGDATVGKCEYCGCVSTLPKTDDERQINLFNRANHFRLLGEFDKALAAYENIIAEDDTNAEAHWGAVLCRFGIEYVDDPDTHKKIPTCHRASFDSILTDLDYEQALQYANPAAKGVYEAEAREIDTIQKGILAISKSEDPYDIFISYKENTDGGSRTKDSVLAQDIYDRLTKEGYRVFFSRISLEDKIGQQYEPYIFSALNSAKVMLVVGTDRDNFNAPWVKNEWSRFLALLKKDSSRLLIPCYKGMDAYELPEELLVFQCQDMGKIGFEQDLIRGIKKVLTKETPKSFMHSGEAPGRESLLKRALLFLKDCDWKSASTYFDRVLDIDPECAEAYAGKLCASLSAPTLQVVGKLYISSIEREFQPGKSTVPPHLTSFGDYKKAVAYARQPLLGELREQEQYVCDKIREKLIARNKMEITINTHKLTELEHIKSDIDDACSDIRNKISQAEKAKHIRQGYLDRDTEVINSETKFISRVSNISLGVCLAVWGIVFIIDLLGDMADEQTFGHWVSFILGGAVFFGICYGITYLIAKWIKSPADQRLDAAKSGLSYSNKQIAEIDEQIAQLQRSLESKNNESRDLENQIEQMRVKIEALMAKNF